MGVISLLHLPTTLPKVQHIKWVS